MTDVPNLTPDDKAKLMLEKLNGLVDRFDALANEINNTLEPITLGFAQRPLMDNVKLYEIICYFQDAAKEVGRVANVCDPQVADRVTKQMQQQDMDELRYNGYKYSPDNKTFINVSAANKPFILNWLKTHPEGRELVKEDYNAKSFQSFAEKLRNEGKSLPEQVSVHDQPILTRRKVRGA